MPDFTPKNLKKALRALPSTIGSHDYGLRSDFDFLDNDEDISVYGDKPSALNHMFEVTFCPNGRANGIMLLGTGPGLEAVADILEHFLPRSPGHIILQKWVEDLTQAAKSAKVRQVSKLLTRQSIDLHVEKCSTTNPR